MKHEWRKKEKGYYQPKNMPEFIEIPEFGFYTLRGQGNPGDEVFGEYISVLYALSYAVKMSAKKGNEPEGYFDYTVYPLEGIWDLTEEAKARNSDRLDKDELVYHLMIRQPDFVTEDLAITFLESTKRKKPHQLLDQVQFERIADGPCIQMLHLGSYDNEPESFALMEQFAKDAGYQRISKTHREIYLSDARKVAPEKLKTVLRFSVK